MSRKAIIGTVILLLLVALAAIFTPSPSLTPESPESIGGDQDEYGCLVAAGYSWCEAKDRCIRSWEEYCTNAEPKQVVFVCEEEKTVRATFYPDDDAYVDLALSDGRMMSLPRAISASGARYAKEDESIVFWNKGDTAFIVEDGITTFAGCTLEKDEDPSLLGEAKTSYATSTEGRSKNIELGTAKINGTVVKAGEEFSFLETLGTISVEEGYSIERVFRDGQLALGLGGGLCQVATTLFNSALEAGLPIIERRNHTFAVAYAPPGRDATIAHPAPDFRFKNDTGNDITITGTTANKDVLFEVHGTPDGRISTIGEATITDNVPAPPIQYIETNDLPKGEEECVNTPHSGYTATVIYAVTYLDGTIQEQEFISKYQPAPGLCYRGTDERITVARLLPPLQEFACADPISKTSYLYFKKIF